MSDLHTRLPLYKGEDERLRRFTQQVRTMLENDEILTAGSTSVADAEESVASLTTTLNSLLAALRTAGVIT